MGPFNDVIGGSTGKTSRGVGGTRQELCRPSHSENFRFDLVQ